MVNRVLVRNRKVRKLAAEPKALASLKGLKVNKGQINKVRVNKGQVRIRATSRAQLKRAANKDRLATERKALVKKVKVKRAKVSRGKAKKAKASRVKVRMPDLLEKVRKMARLARQVIKERQVLQGRRPVLRHSRRPDRLMLCVRKAHWHLDQARNRVRRIF